MKVQVAGALVIVIAIGYCIFRVRRWILSKPWLVALGRWLSGEAHHGHPVTDAGWFRKGEKPLTRTGHAGKWWHRPRWQRALHRTGGTLAAFVLIWAFLVNWRVTALIIACLLIVSAVFGARATSRWARTRTERRELLHPTHLALHAIAGHPRALPASSWISAERDNAGAVLSATFKFPPSWPADSKDEKWFVDTAGKKLGIQSPQVTRRHLGPVPLLVLRHSPPPPGKFGMGTLLPELLSCKPDELLIGVGKGEELVKASLATDSPHIAISMGTGAGKSNLAAWLLLQILLRGGIGLVLDAKRRLSYPWLLKDGDRNVVQLPNIAYAWTVAQLHDGMEWLTGELDRRGDVAFAGMDTTGKVHANVGPRLFIIAEELNLAVGKLRAYWQEIREPGQPVKSPAFTGLGDTAFAGRQVDMHEVLMGQLLTADVTGSKDSSVRTQCGIKLMARYELAGWKMMCGDVPMPPSPSTLGRIQTVTAGGVHETQVPGFDPVPGRELVLAGQIARLPSTIPRSLVTGIPRLSDSGPSPAAETVSGPPAVSAGPRLVSLREAVDQGLVRPATTLGSLRMARFRDRAAFPDGRPSPKGDLYDAEELAAYDMARG